MDAAALRIEVSAALADDLGVYTLLNGETTPAISVRPEGQRLAAGTVASGLEVVILSEPRLSPVGAYLQQEAIRQFIVFLVGWDDTADTTVAAEKLVYIFPGTVWQEIPLAKRIGPTNQARVIIQSPATPGLLPTAGPRTGASNVTLVITGAAAGSSGGAITGASTLALTLSGASTGTVAIVGTSSQSLTITGSATGVIGSVSIGSSSATLTITGSAAGSVVVSGASNQSLAIGGASIGVAPIAGISSQVLAITGSAAGVIGAVAIGTSTATLTITGTAAGAVLITGSSTQSLAITGTSAGAIQVSGASAQTLGITGAATATVQVAGSSAQTLSINGTAAGVVGASGVTGASSQTLSITGTASGVVFDVDAFDWISRIETADGQALPTDARIAYNSFVVGLKADSNWTPITVACMLRGARTVAGCLVPMKGTAPTAVDAAFVSGDYTRTTGLIGSTATGSGSRKALDTNVNANTLSKSNFHISVDTVSMVGGSSGAEIGAIDWVAFPVPGRLEIGYWSGGAVNEFGTGAITPSDGPYTIAGGSAQLGFKCINRSVSTEATVRSGGTNYTDSRTATGSFMTGNLWVFARHNIPSPLATYESAGPRIGWYSIGTALTSLADLETRISNFTTAIGLVTY